MRTTYKAALFTLLAAAALLPAPAARAEETAEDEKRRLMQFAANNAAFDKTVEEAARALFVRQSDNCGTAEQAVRQLPTPYGRISFPPDRDFKFPPPTNGIWAEHVKIRACGRVWQINMLAVSRNDGDPMLMAMLPGDTLADPAVQRDAERMGATRIRKADETCSDDAKIIYTRLVGFKKGDGPPVPEDAGEGWYEEWTYRFCQRTLPLQFAFLPRKDGGYEITSRIVPAAMPKVPESKPESKPDSKPDSKPAADAGADIPASLE